ncbi:MAG: amidase family protein, partial [Anaerolineales bacterium]|nr:amidase family protein [Anaerolineales bacterium]
MKIQEYVQYDGLGLAELIRKKEVSATELAVLALEAVAKVNPQINAVIEVYSQRVETADNGLNPAAPFAGVPFFIKDFGSAEAGQRQELGSRLAKGRRAERESYLTQRFKKAGLILLGRTTTPEFAQASTTESALTGATRNPWDLERTVGGSSGGAAAAVATGVLPMAHASDGGGSIRIPAAACGLVGLKPSRGRVTVGPDSDEGLFGMAQEFIVSRTVRDTAAMLDAVSQPAPGDPFTIIQPKRPYLQEVGILQPALRIAYTTGTWNRGVIDPEMAQAVQAVATRCEAMGHILEEAMPQFDVEGYLKAARDMWAVDLALLCDSVGRQTGRPINAEYVEAVNLDVYQHGKKLTVADLMDSLSALNRVRRQVGQFFERYDLFLTSALHGPAVPLGSIHTDQPISQWEWIAKTDAFSGNLELFNVTGQPAISLPLAQSKANLPLGI